MLRGNDFDNLEGLRWLEVERVVQIPQLTDQFVEVIRILRLIEWALDVLCRFKERFEAFSLLLRLNLDSCSFVGEEGVLKHGTEALLVLLQ